MWVRNRAGAYEKAGYGIGLFLAANKRYLGKRESSPLGYPLQRVKPPLPPSTSPAPSVHAYTYAHTYAHTPAQSYTRPFPSPRI